MASKRQLFLSHVAQTSNFPLLLDVAYASGVYIYDKSGKAYLDMNSGIAVSSLGHCHPKVVESVCNQARKYMHTMVYGEHIQDPQILFAQQLIDHIDDVFNSVYFLMSGTEATELAMKIVRRFTGRYEIAVCRNAYHGSTLGAESLRSDEKYKAAFMPLVPGIRFIEFNNTDDLNKIDNRVAGVICEPIQGEAGVRLPQDNFLQKMRNRCDDVGALMVLDEIQTGFGRTGFLFAHQKYKVVPDLFLIGKAMGGGMPIAGVVSRKDIMACLVNQPALGHITTFGGHPVSAAAAATGLKILLDDRLIESVIKKETLIHNLLKHPIIKEIRSSGLMMAVELKRQKYLKHVVAKAFESGVLIDYFLFNKKAFRLAPPLISTPEDLERGCRILLESMDYAQQKYA